MTNYERPLVIANSDVFEGVYASISGSDPKITGTIRWSNHNSGSHSDLSIDLKADPNMTGEYIKVTATFVGKGNIISVGGSGGPAQMSVSGNTIVFERFGHFNPGESFQFSFNNVVFSETGDDHDTSVHKGSYYETGTHIEIDNGKDWILDIQCS